VSRPALTDEQAAAVRHGEGDACVMAGAGSGKTTVLVERALHVASALRTDLRRVAAVTFTEKAAAEMRDRIARAVGEAGGPDARARERDVEFAPISTIHSFCARLLRRHAIDAGVDPAFSVLEETEATLLLDDAFEAVSLRFLRAEDPRLPALRLLDDREIGKELRRFVEALRGRGLGADDLRWVRGPTAIDAAVARVEAARAAVAAAVEDRRPPPPAARAFAEALAAFPDPRRLAEPTFGNAREALVAAEGVEAKTRTLPVPHGVNRERDEVYAAYGALAEALLDEVGAREAAPGFVGYVREVLAAYDQAKRDRGALDFTDLERETLALLDGLAAAGRRLPGAPEALLVDEFQDVNPLQARILGRLREDAAGRRVPLFAVGDPKQSIYRFRGADVSVIRREWEAAGASGRAALSESFRSRPELVAFHNALFDRLFAGGKGGADPQRMRSSARFHRTPAFPPAQVLLPELLVVDAGEGSSLADRHDAQARAIARRIRALVETGEIATRIRTDAEVASPRRLEWGDFAVLLRTRTHAKRYERALLEAGIPFHVGRGQGYYQTEEMADLVHLLRVVHDPWDAFAVAAWLTSPAVGGTDRDLLEANLRAEGPGSPFDRAAALPSARAAADVVRRLRRVAAGSSLEETVAAAVEAVEAVPVALLQDGGLRRARNVEKALAIARRLDAAGGRSLHDFLRWLDDLRNREVEEPEAATGAERDSVALLTIHGAKGLQWPVVFLADAGQRDGPVGGSFVLDPDGGFSWRLRDPLEGKSQKAGGYSVRHAAEKAEQEREALRLLYVALTRAEDRLVVVAGAQGATGAGQPAEISGWGRALWGALGAPFGPGTHERPCGEARALVTVESVPEDDGASDRRSPYRRHGVDALLGADPVEGVAEADVVRAREAWARVSRPPPGLGRTPFVVSVSDLLLFAESPERWYRERALGAEPAALGARRAESDDPAAGREEETTGDPDAALAAAERWDEGTEPIDGIDRAALGRAVHAVLEHVRPDGEVPPDAVDAALAVEFPDGVPAAARTAARAMVRRFLGSPTARDLAAALRAGRGPRREVPFHARIAFPEREKVGDFDSLLVKGTIDLWLPTSEGVRVLDHKTNSPRGRLRTVEAIVSHYAPQLRLYALAAERVPGTRVAGAGLLLLDPEWDAPVEASVDVSGEALRETRRLCRAFAVSMLESRFPARWQDLLR
jgi:ATP-dependent helicase/nuclease subunit A